MTGQADAIETRELLVTAKRYRRDGYRVLRPDAGDPLPAFLDGWRPDLVAERDDDRVVIEIKRTRDLSGANDLVSLAELVAAQPGWRLELIAVPAGRTVVPLALDQTNNEVDRLVAKGHTKAAFIVACAMIENIVTYAALSQGMNSASHPFRNVLRELVVAGVISEEARETIETALAARNAMMHVDGTVPLPGQVAALSTLAKELTRDIASANAA